ncbi:hypothetical protein WA026_006540 [Henosepilachna vigintioctopunctata]|uniref:5'-3' exoribonuclease 1 n=1 Tax=Henosepilachna vigintioctopunctata TaxID=420089 RepID=A0AAW1UFA5_9CUCU
MGVPKFFRYISERYPCLSELVREYEVPEFDNLYLDMNGIIHNCSHPDDGNIHFRISEEKVFSDIFHYIEVLFQMIKPLKVFFMAVDGVAPRAKMNQQRGRRFRSIKDSRKLEADAINKGEKLPSDPRFDSNCITPGTEFMARLHEQLKYFVVKKVSQDPLWRRCQIILSGHETPGEGEHKIMDFIRYKRSQPGYDPNTRHCLYGLDADLIMLGLCTHDPHFSLLREEVKFGRKSTKHNPVPEEVRFFLLHLSLMREYLELEFSILKETLRDFKFDIEKIIDDWVLMGFLVGNDFIPNLPNLHIVNGALPIVYKIYMNILPELGGYINEGGILNLERFEVFMKKLSELDIQNFEEIRENLLYMEAKTGRKIQPFAKRRAADRLIKSWKQEHQEDFVIEDFSESSKGPRDSGLSALIAATDNEYLCDDDSSDDSDEFENYKRSYYMNKLEYDKVTPKVMKSQAEGYVRAIQWNLHYYYNGVCSWSWYYPHHYAPYISDIKNFQDLNLEYDYGKPFLPYEQLLAVLPSGSKELLPKCYQNLMTDENSPIKKFYPENFDTDLNGKRQEWEAVVLVPFIDEKKLLETMKIYSNDLSPDEMERNKHGPMLCYTYTKENLGLYESPMYFPDVTINHANVTNLTIDEIRVPMDKLVKGAYPGVLFDVYYPGFPTLKHLNYQGCLKKAKVKVFEQPSRGDNMIIQVIPSKEFLMPKFLWIYLENQFMVVAVLNSKEKYVYVGDAKEPVVEESPKSYRLEVEGVTEYYSNRLGIEFGKVLVLVKVKTMIGQKYMITPNGKITLEKVFCENSSNYPLQLVVENINVYRETHDVSMTLETLFPVGSSCHLLTPNEYYGREAIVQNFEEDDEGIVPVSVLCSKEPNLSKPIYMAEEEISTYKTLQIAASESGMPNYLFARITGSFFATARSRDGGFRTVNLGLDLKLNKKNLETPGYTKKIDGNWHYTLATVKIVNAYADKFPELFKFITNSKKNKDETGIEEIFPEDSDEKMREVHDWLKAQPHNRVVKINCNSQFLGNEVVEEIERIIDNFDMSDFKNIKMKCKPDLLYKSELIFGNILPDKSVQVRLFDRIVNVRSNHTVPYGLKGTVIGIHAGTLNSMYDVVFDSKFEGGNEINCSDGRGFRIPLNAFINISHGLRLHLERIGKSDNTKIVPTQNHDNYMQRKYQNNYQNTRNSDNAIPQSSAFAKFNNNQMVDKANYNAVPPVMLDGEPIYKSSHHSWQNYNRQKQPQNFKQEFQGRFNSTSEPYDPRHLFRKQYAPNSFQGTTTSNCKNVSYTTRANDTKLHDPERNIKSKHCTILKKTDFLPNFTKIQQRDPTDDTADALKKVLKISTTLADHSTSSSKSKNPNNENLVSKTEFKLDMSSNKPFSVQLLNYYQSKALGLPRYQYNNENDVIYSQIKLPNRQIILGRPAKTREEASELVAEEALKTLLSMEKLESSINQHKQSPKAFPSLPKKWSTSAKKVDAQVHQKNNASINNTWKDLIPLQAVKKEKAGTSNRFAVLTESMNDDDTDEKSKKAVLTEKPQNSTNQVSQATEPKAKKSKKPRKMRIAANFPVQS